MIKKIGMFVAIVALSAPMYALNAEEVMERQTVECGANWTYGAGINNAWSKTVSSACDKSATVASKHGSDSSGRIAKGAKDAYAETASGGTEEYYYNIWEVK